MATLLGASSGTLELTAVADGTQPFLSAKIGSGSNPSNQIYGLSFARPAGTRIIEQDPENFVLTAGDDTLEFILMGRLVATFDVYARLHIRGIVEELAVSDALSARFPVQPSLVIYDPATQSWFFGVTTSFIEPVLKIDSDGNVSLFEGREEIFPLTAAASPSFGSDYWVDSSGDTHITQDRSRSSAFIEQSSVSNKTQGTLVVQEIIEEAF